MWGLPISDRKEREKDDGIPRCVGVRRATVAIMRTKAFKNRCRNELGWAPSNFAVDSFNSACSSVSEAAVCYLLLIKKPGGVARLSEIIYRC